VRSPLLAVHTALLLGLVMAQRGASVERRSVGSPSRAAERAVTHIPLLKGASCEPSWRETFGASMGPNDAVLALTAFDDSSGSGPALYVGGLFTAVGRVPAAHVARWDGTSWSPLGTGMDGAVNTLAVFDDGSGAGPQLYAGGSFTVAGGNVVHNVARWNGTSWSALGEGTNGTVRVLATYSDGEGRSPGLYAGGEFTLVDGSMASGIARWNGFYWSPLAGGVNGSVLALATFGAGSPGGALLYAGGVFTTAGTSAASHVARWNGTYWTALDAGLNNSVSSLVTWDDGSGNGPALYATGGFSASGQSPLNAIASWNGTGWSPLGSGINGFGVSLGLFNDGAGTAFGDAPALFVGGFFTSAGGVSANRIARWDGAAWSPLGAGTDSLVLTMIAVGDEFAGGAALFAGGAFLRSPAGDRFLGRWSGCATVCQADLDHDGIIGGGDLAILLGAWGTSDPVLDLDGNGVVAGGDLAVVLGAWGDC